ncbi:class I SAM-dependent methyltransferase [Haloferax sulfurifontis]|uniref:SAM-dependent methyltransferase n=2 Tax=Haloferax sulfurifontis TaxID=255616 RepID=M0IPV3_9EURY|nr:methyltransferase domain-containing protein [Haloferax sulfurifontis]ELZ97873.1 SAM-dependent methyltransferase [Haloferax sulfurifontis ATCC BAA-897]GGC57774.1 SAM-dependent methyltransferase [Haloferax sulfurifontis]
MERFQNTSLPDWDWWGKLWPTPGETLRDLGLSPGDTVAEIGCGNGYFALPAARIVAPATVYAVDLDDDLLAELDQLAAQQRIDNVVSVRGDARELSGHLADPVDVALFANAFHGVDDPDEFLTEVESILADGGRFVVVNWRPLPRAETTVAGEPRGPPTDLRLGPEETAAMVAEATDLAATAELDIPPYHYALVFERRE